MLLSIIMPVYNESIKEINESINSILNQTFRDFEYIIIDDNPSSNKIKRFLTKKSYYDSRIKLIFNSKNLKLVRSENRGIRASSGKYIMRIDADDISCKNRVYSQLHFLILHNLDLVGCNCSLLDSMDNIINEDLFSDITQFNQNKIKKILYHYNIFSGSNLLFKKEVFNTLNGYRISLIDDYDFVTRALIYGFKIGYQSNSLVYKRNRKNSITNSNILRQFIGLYQISKYLKKFDFNKICPKNLLKNKMFNIYDLDIKKFHLFKFFLHKFKHKENIYLLFRCFIIIITSPIIFKFYLWSKLFGSKRAQERMMR